MPTNSKKVSKKNWFNKTFTEQKKRIDAFMARRPHRSFRLTRRRDYVRPLDLPGNISFTHHVTQILWQYKKIFGLLVVVYIVLFAVLVGVQSQDTYAALSGTLKEASTEAFNGDIGAFGQAGILFLSIMTSGVVTGLTEAQQVFSVIIFLLIWLATVWLLRNLLAGHKVKLRDGLYNSGGPIFATLTILVVILIQLIPVGVAIVAYSAAAGTGLLTGGGAPAMLFWIGAGLLAILSLFWITSSLFAMIIITLPGMYPLEALRSAGDIVLGRRIKILLRWVWMLFVVGVFWAVVLIPIILLDMGIKSLWPAIQWLPIVPVSMVVIAAGTAVWIAAYIYLLYRKVVDYVPEV